MTHRTVTTGMSLSELQMDAMQELSNMAINRAAGKLAELTGRSIRLRVPRVGLLETEELRTFLRQRMGGTIPCINQSFTGSFSGTSMLIYPRDSAAQLASLVLNQRKNVAELSTLERSALIEIGNILINTFMGFIGEALELSLNLSIPQMAVLSQESVETILMDRQTADAGEQTVAMMIDNEMSVEETHVSGHMIILVDLQVAIRWIARMEELWLG